MIPIRTSVRGPRPPVATVAIAIVAVLVFVFQLDLDPDDLDTLLTTWGVIPARMWHVLALDPGNIDRWLTPIFTSMFLHGGWGHVLGNMLFLWVFGHTLESRIGTLRFAALYFAGGVVAAFFQSMLSPDSTVPMIGASGAIATVLGAYFVVYPRSWVTVLVPVFIFPLFFELPALLFLGVWFFEQLFAGALWALSPLAAKAGGVAWWAHVGGFLTGAITGLVARTNQAPPPRRRPRAPHIVWGLGP
jgi:membrane associated rhomboid family serine protease